MTSTPSSRYTGCAVGAAAGPLPVDVAFPTGRYYELTAIDIANTPLTHFNQRFGGRDPMTYSTVGEPILTNGSKGDEPSPSSPPSHMRRLNLAPVHDSATNASRSDRPSAWTRLALPHVPWLTAAVFALTAAGGIAQHIVPGLLGQLERSPAGLHGQWWRIGTALFVQDGGLAGLVSNLVFLAVIGAAAEHVCTRRRWVVQYFGTGLLAELVGYAWQPIGGGNSIAICGLGCAVAVTAWQGRAWLAPWVPSVVLVWCGALLAYVWEPLIILGIISGVAASRAVLACGEPGLAVLLGVLFAGVVLAAAANIHGAALLVGSVLALLLRPHGPDRSRDHAAEPPSLQHLPLRQPTGLGAFHQRNEVAPNTNRTLTHDTRNT